MRRRPRAHAALPRRGGAELRRRDWPAGCRPRRSRPHPHPVCARGRAPPRSCCWARCGVGRASATGRHSRRARARHPTGTRRHPPPAPRAVDQPPSPSKPPAVDVGLAAASHGGAVPSPPHPKTSPPVTPPVTRRLEGGGSATPVTPPPLPRPHAPAPTHARAWPPRWTHAGGVGRSTSQPPPPAPRRCGRPLSARRQPGRRPCALRHGAPRAHAHPAAPRRARTRRAATASRRRRPRRAGGVASRPSLTSPHAAVRDPPCRPLRQIPHPEPQRQRRRRRRLRPCRPCSAGRLAWGRCYHI